MKMPVIARVIRIALCALVFAVFAAAAASPAPARAAVLTFSEPDFDWLANGTSATPYHIWTVNDHWQQNFTNTGQATATAMDLHLTLDDNSLSPGHVVNLNVLLNNTTVGSLVIPSSTLGPLDFHFDFAPVAGPNYLVKLLETNTVADGQGSVSLALGGASRVTLVPEPAIALPVAFVALAALRGRRRCGRRAA